MTPRQRLLAVSLSLAVVLPLAACAEEATEPSADVVWAGSVCDAYAEVSESIQGINDALPTTPDASTLAQLSEAKDVLESRADAVVAALGDLGDALTADFPTEASPELTSAQKQLAADVDEAKIVVDDAAESLRTLVADPTLANFNDLREKTARAQRGVDQVSLQIRSTGSAANQAARAAFGAAPSCQPFLNPATP